MAHLLYSSGVDAAVQQRISGVIERQTAYMARLVEDLLDMSRVRRGELTLRRESVDLPTVVPVAVEFSHLLMQARKHHLAVIPSAEPLWVSGDHSVDAGPIGPDGYGGILPAVQGGYWLMLAPLPSGRHRVSWTATAQNIDGSTGEVLSGYTHLDARLRLQSSRGKHDQ